MLNRVSNKTHFQPKNLFEILLHNLNVSFGHPLKVKGTKRVKNFNNNTFNLRYILMYLCLYVSRNIHVLIFLKYLAGADLELNRYLTCGVSLEN